MLNYFVRRLIELLVATVLVTIAYIGAFIVWELQSVGWATFNRKFDQWKEIAEIWVLVPSIIAGGFCLNAVGYYPISIFAHIRRKPQTVADRVFISLLALLISYAVWGVVVIFLAEATYVPHSARQWVPVVWAGLMVLASLSIAFAEYFGPKKNQINVSGTKT